MNVEQIIKFKKEQIKKPFAEKEPKDFIEQWELNPNLAMFWYSKFLLDGNVPKPIKTALRVYFNSICNKLDVR